MNKIIRPFTKYKTHNINKLKSMVFEEHNSIEECAEHFNVSQNTIYKALAKIEV